MRNTLATASKNFMTHSPRPWVSLLLLRTDHLGRTARGLDFFECRFRKHVRLYRNLPGQLARTQNFQAMVQLPDQAQFEQSSRVEYRSFESLQLPQVDDRVLFVKNI